MTPLHHRIIHVVSTLATVPPGEISPADRLREDLGLDSISSMELISALAEELALEISIEEAVVASTVGDVIRLAEARLEPETSRASG